VNIQRINEIAARLNIEAINLSSNSVVLEANFNPRIAQGELGLNLEWGYTRSAVASMQRVDVPEKFDLVWHVWFRGTARVYRGVIPEGTVGRPDLPMIAEVVTDFLLQYAVEEGFNPDSQSLHEFALHNVPIHVWPYWREWLNSLSVRMGLSPFVLGMHILPKSKDVPLTASTAKST
jgi:hypothetical protein